MFVQMSLQVVLIILQVFFLLEDGLGWRGAGGRFGLRFQACSCQLPVCWMFGTQMTSPFCALAVQELSLPGAAFTRILLCSWWDLESSVDLFEEIRAS